MPFRNIVELVSHTLYLYIFLQFFDALVVRHQGLLSGDLYA